MTRHFHGPEIDLGDKHITLLSLAHVSAETLRVLEEIIEGQRPDTVCVELDDQRLHWLENRAAWESLRLLDIIKNKEMPQLSSHLALRIFQKRVGSFEGAEPGDGVVDESPGEDRAHFCVRQPRFDDRYLRCPRFFPRSLRLMTC